MPIKRNVKSTSTGTPINMDSENLPPHEVLFREISFSGTSSYKSVGIPDYNPDDLVGKKGLEIYAKMMNDDQVKAVVTMKKFARLMSSWSIESASSDPKDKEIAEFVRINIDNLEGTFEDTLLNILTALEYGYSITEEIWYRIEKGKWIGKIGLQSLKTKQPFYYSFDSDEFGNLRPNGILYSGGINPTVLSSATPTTSSWLSSTPYSNYLYGSGLPTNKFVIYTYQKEFQNWYGKSDLRAAYRSWWSKELLIRFMNIYMERFGMPTHIATYPKGTKKTDKDALKDILDKVQTKYSIVIPEDIKVSLLQAGGGGESGFSNAIEMHNRFIARSILVPDLLGFTQAMGGGSYALGKKHFDVFLWMLKKLGKDLEESVVGEQIIKRLVDLNFSGVEDYPKFRFEDITEEGTQTKAMIVAAGIQGGFINPTEDWIRAYLSLPEADPEIPLGLPQTSMGMIPEVPLDSGMEDELNQQLEEDGIPPESQVGQYAKSLRKKFFRMRSPIKRTIVPVKVYKDKSIIVSPTKFDKKMKYSIVKKDIENYEQQTVKELSSIVQKQRDAFIKDIEKKRIFEDKNFNEVNKLQLKFVGDFKKELEKRLVKMYLDSKVELLKELIEGDAPIELKVLFQGGIVQDWNPVPPTEAIEYFKRKILAKVTKSNGVKKLLDLATNAELGYYASKAFAISGIERDYILNEAKQIILEGLKNGDSKTAMFDLESLFNEYLETGELKDDNLVTPYRLELIVRQNISEALNAGRKAMLEDEDISDFVPYWEYSAILDDRVRPTHAEMHGRIYRSDDPIWDVIYPPNGFNCRCGIIPITQAEVDREIKNGSGITLSNSTLPPDFPDQGFTKFVEIRDIKIKEFERLDSSITKDESVSKKLVVEYKLEKPEIDSGAIKEKNNFIEKLQEENRELSKKLDEWEKKSIGVSFEENSILKKLLSEKESLIKTLQEKDEVDKISRGRINKTPVGEWIQDIRSTISGKKVFKSKKYQSESISSWINDIKKEVFSEQSSQAISRSIEIKKETEKMDVNDWVKNMKERISRKREGVCD